MHIYSISLEAIKTNLDKFNSAAIEASKGVDGNLLDAQIGMMVSSHAVSANLAVLKTAAQMNRSLIDIFA